MLAARASTQMPLIGPIQAHTVLGLVLVCVEPLNNQPLNNQPQFPEVLYTLPTLGLAWECSNLALLVLRKSTGVIRCAHLQELRSLLNGVCSAHQLECHNLI